MCVRVRTHTHTHWCTNTYRDNGIWLGHKKEMLSFAMTQVELDTILCEMSVSEWQVPHDFTPSCNLRKKPIRKRKKKDWGTPRKWLWPIENTLMVRGEVGRGWVNRWWGLRSALVMSTRCMQVLNHYIVHLKLILQCTLPNWYLNRNF